MVRRMTFRHVLVSLSVACLAACSSSDTIVSLNVTATDRVPAVERIQVTFKQGSHSYVRNFAPPSEMSAAPDPVASIKNGFFERIALPGDWDEASAKVSVEAFRTGGSAFDPPLVDETTVKLEPEGVVAAYVKLDIPEPPPVMMGAGGAGGDGAGGSGAGGDGAGGNTPAGGASSEAGAAGEGGAAGAG